jgi:hypothetical protein
MNPKKDILWHFEKPKETIGVLSQNPPLLVPFASHSPSFLLHPKGLLAPWPHCSPRVKYFCFCLAQVVFIFPIASFAVNLGHIT